MWHFLFIFRFFVFNIYRLETGIEFEATCSSNLTSSKIENVTWNEFAKDLNSSSLAHDLDKLIKNDTNSQTLLFLGKIYQIFSDLKIN